VLRGEALERYEAAREDFKAQRFQQALAGFVRAYARSREPRLRWNAAACLRKLERNAEALRTLDAYLDEAEKELTPEELDEARRSADALRQLVTTVLVSVDPPDAQVSIDGTPLDAVGTDVYLEPGRHAFLVQKSGFQSQVREQAVRAGERFAWSVTLAPLAAAAKPAVPPAVVPPTVELRPTPPPPPVRPRWAPWAVAGGGLAAVAAGAVLLGTSAATFDRLRAECGIVCPPARWAGARDAELAGVILLSAGSALAAAGLGWGLWWSLDGVKAQLAVGPTRLSLEVRF
jgi:tetratricopeptide (TPR) repeat protein